jgi:hypothetical protein
MKNPPENPRSNGESAIPAGVNSTTRVFGECKGQEYLYVNREIRTDGNYIFTS